MLIREIREIYNPRKKDAIRYLPLLVIVIVNFRLTKQVLVLAN